MKSFIISESDASKRLDKFLHQHTEASRNYIKQWIVDGLVLVNGKSQKPSYLLKTKDVIHCMLKETVSLSMKKQDIPLTILYEDDDILVIDKPKNMMVHPTMQEQENTLVNALLYHCEDSLSGINGVLRPGIVHRLDRDTTGLLLVAKNDQSHQFLAEQFHNREVKRIYHGICLNYLPQDHFSVEGNITRSKYDRKKMILQEGDGKYSRTDFTVLERKNNYSYFEASLHTGRTHQIRVHLSSLSCPILGDRLYSNQKKYERYGQFLHSKALGFIHPRSKEYLYFESELPKYFKNFLKKEKFSEHLYL